MLPVRSRLFSWGISTVNTCCICNLQEKTCDHLFLHCDFSSNIWSRILRRLGQPMRTFVDWTVMIQWLSLSSGTAVPILHLLASQAVIFFTWKERNNRLHTGSMLAHSEVFKQIDRCIKDLILSRLHRKSYKNLFSLWFTYEWLTTTN